MKKVNDTFYKSMHFPGNDVSDSYRCYKTHIMILGMGIEWQKIFLGQNNRNVFRYKTNTFSVCFSILSKSEGRYIPLVSAVNTFPYLVNES